MSLSPDHRTKLLRLRSTVAGLSVTLGFVRLQRALSRKYDPDQPREPAGGPGGGRWASNGGGQGTSGQSTSGAEETVTEDGSRVLSLRIRSQPHRDWDEQHTVIAPDGTQTVFEMAGRTQTIRDGETGAILGRSTLIDGRAEPDAFPQDARSPLPGQSRFIATANAGLALLGAFAQRIVGGPAIFVGPASEYQRGTAQPPQAIWVGQVDQADLESACPRYGEVQSLLDRTMAEVTQSGLYLNPTSIGKRVHHLMAQEIKSQNNPNFIAEISYDKTTGIMTNPGKKNSVRLDILENIQNTTVCIYDPKTGEKGFKPQTAVDYATAVQLHFPGATRFIVIEMRPTR